MKRAALFSIPFMLAAVALGTASIAVPHRILNYEHILLQACLNVAIFVINFSFIQYQFSPYRVNYRGISSVHIWAAALVLVISIAPIAGVLYFSPSSSIQLMLAVIPIEMGTGILLSLLVDHLNHPTTALRELTSEQRLTEYAHEYGAAISYRLAEEERYSHDRPARMPDFEWSLHPVARLRNDGPFQAITSLGLTAVSNNDPSAFEQILEKGIFSVEALERYHQQLPDSSIRARTILTDSAYESTRTLVAAALEEKRSSAFGVRAARILSEATLRQAGLRNQGRAEFNRYIGSLQHIASSSLASGNSEAALLALKTSRIAAQRGIDDPDSSDMMYEYRLMSPVAVMKRLGHDAVSASNSDIAYRAMDALGWFGCEAVKARKLELTRFVLQALVQLGREARHSKMECFYQRCGVMPVDHVDERVGWLLTWVPVDGTNQSEWESMFSTAYSRLRGQEMSLQIATTAGTRTIIKSSNPYQETHTWHDGSRRTIDFSDVNTLKDLVIH